MIRQHIAKSVPFSVFLYIYDEYIYETVDHFCLGFFLATDRTNSQDAKQKQSGNNVL